MKRKVVMGIVWALITAQLIFIFSMSAQDGQASSQLSVRVTRVFARVLTPNFTRMSGAKQNRIVRKYHRYVRKLAHLTEYACLGALLALALRQKEMRGVLAAVCICVLLAMLDETRQMFSGGRTPLATDVLIDSLGAGMGAFAMYGLVYLKKRRKTCKDSS